jgi:predicted ATPase/serine/threonine protein kinase/Tfp pilus assembly protein PilF
MIGKTYAQYRILSSIGVGGMGEVFLAEDTVLRRKTALKFLAVGLRSKPENLERFLREARAASALNHPNICTIYEINAEGEAPFIAMEYIEGETVAQMIARRRRNIRQSAEIMIEVVAALAEAHDAGIIHRDIKPANIIVNKRGYTKILDFGLAKENAGNDPGRVKQTLTREGVVLGTAVYMSPEQARGQVVDGRTDVWSIGVCLYEMLTRRQPFTGESSADTISAILRLDPPSPATIYPDISVEMDRIVMKCLRKNRDDRYWPAELLADLKNLRAGVADDLNEIEMGSDDETHTFDAASTEIAIPKITDEHRAPSNLSRMFRPIIGREREVEEVCGILRGGDIQILTLTGVGGMGKTRLAQAVAEKLVPEFRDGVYFVELAAVTQPEMIAATIAQTLGVKEEGERPAVEILGEHLVSRSTLIVVDNFEQVVEGSPVLAEILASASSTKMLVTSRVTLRLQNEHEYIVPPLAPPDGLKVPFVEIEANPAVRLFVDRAHSANKAFALSKENARDVAAICTKLEGLPLAIELAAARTKVLSPAEILEKLDYRLQLLTGGPRDLPERQRTMHGAIAWSYDLLTDEEKRLFRQLSVFNGGFRLEAVEAIFESGPQTSSHTHFVLDLVSSLVDQSLLLQREQRSGGHRFRMLEVVREFATEALGNAGESENAKTRHTEYFVNLGERAEPFLQAAQSSEWLDKLEEDHNNVRAAMEWALANDAEKAVRLAVALRNFWLLHSHLSEGYRWMKAAQATGVDVQPELRFKLMNGLGLAARFRGDLRTAREAYEQGLSAGHEVDDKQGVAVSSRGLGLVAMQQGDTESARRYFESGLAISRELDDKFGTALSLSFLGDLARTVRDHEHAKPLFEEALALFRELDNKSAMSDALNNLGAAAFSNGDLTAARDSFAEALSVATDLGNKITISNSLDGFGALALEQDDIERAAKLAGAADALRESIGYRIEPAEAGFRNEYVKKLWERIGAESFQKLYDQGKTADHRPILGP